MFFFVFFNQILIKSCLVVGNLLIEDESCSLYKTWISRTYPIIPIFFVKILFFLLFQRIFLLYEVWMYVSVVELASRPSKVVHGYNLRFYSSLAGVKTMTLDHEKWKKRNKNVKKLKNVKKVRKNWNVLTLRSRWTKNTSDASWNIEYRRDFWPFIFTFIFTLISTWIF